MEEKHIESDLAQLAKRIKSIEFCIYLSATALFIFLFLVDLSTNTLVIPLYKRMLHSLLEGAPLPQLTNWATTIWIDAWILDLLFAIVMLVLLSLKKMRYFLIIGITLNLILALKIFITYFALNIPLLSGYGCMCGY